MLTSLYLLPFKLDHTSQRLIKLFLASVLLSCPFLLMIQMDHVVNSDVSESVERSVYGNASKQATKHRMRHLSYRCSNLGDAGEQTSHHGTL